jgi:glycine/D-amino acid oxidase-like deaminating enzyme/nitrite reductase/ring-hydroxylating ferredoxin subunit
MTNDGTQHRSAWADVSLPRFEPLERDLEVDVAIVGGGITGITAAHLLAEEGVRVALLERDRLGAGDTQRTTAHLTYVTDSRLHELVSKFGKDAARSFWDAGAAAIDEVDRIVRALKADCDYRWVPGFLYRSPRAEDAARERERLQEDATLARELGFEASFVESVPFTGLPGVQFTQQARFHPLKYLAALVGRIRDRGGAIFEKTSFEETEEEPLAVRANGRRVRCKYVIIATHNPLMGRKGLLTASLLQTKLSLYTTYVLGLKLPASTFPEALFWDTGNPYDYLRVDSRAGAQYAIFGGDDVKTGQEDDAEQVFTRLSARARQLLPQGEIENRWLGQVIETDDGLPFIGEHAECEFIATGFAGNGLTLGTLAAMMARDRYIERKNPWTDLFRVTRKPFHGGVWRYLRENADYPYYLLRDRLAPADTKSVDAIPNGEGRIVRLDGEKVAAYRNGRGALTLLSPVCTHLKCIVRWNSADQTWDCPCHGSRFRPTGEVLAGPAEAPLAKR